MSSVVVLLSGSAIGGSLTGLTVMVTVLESDPLFPSLKFIAEDSSVVEVQVGNVCNHSIL